MLSRENVAACCFRELKQHAATTGHYRTILHTVMSGTEGDMVLPGQERSFLQIIPQNFPCSITLISSDKSLCY